MKKIIAILAVFCAMSISAGAADLSFTPVGGGKWIFCNNPEGIRNCDLMNSDSDEPSYIMNNENLEPDLYDFLICHINTTETDDGYGMGYNIELDIELTAVKDSEIVINKAFFDTPSDEAYIYSDGTWAKETQKFGCINGLASYLGINLAQLNGAWLYEAQPYESVTLKIKKGETVWLSDYMDNYTTVGYNKPVQILGQIEILSGKMNLNVAAFKAGEEIGDRSGFNADATYGSYAYCRTQKGIADSLPQTSVDLEYTIDNKVKDGDTIPNKVFNQYKPDGYVTSTWCTNLNPQDDVWSKDISVQNDLLVLKYEDDKKLTFYGKNVKNKNKDNVWIWDPFHSDTGQYPGASTWQSEDDYVPNYELSAKRNNEGYACSMGNYCVTETYNLKVNNITNQDWYFEYAAETTSNIVVYVEDENGKNSGLLKGENNPATRDVMASVLVPAKSEKEFSINMVLPINYVGGIKNSFQISKESHVGKTYEDYITEPRAKQGPITTGIIAEEVKDELPKEVQDIIRGNYDCFELVKTDNGYMLRWIEWDGCPYYYTSYWDRVKTIYYLDESYNVVDRYAFDKLIKLAVYYDGYYYVEDADYNRYKSQDGQNWEVYTKRMPLPDIVFENSQPSQWADKEVKRAYSLDVVPYKFKDKLVYTEDMTRERFADILASMLELADKLPESGGTAFDDTTNENVLRLRNVKIISGYDEKTFGPKNSITRQEAAVLLYNTAKYMGYDFDKVTYSYKDDAEIASWAKEAVYQMNNIGIMSGIGDDKFAPELNYTNEQSIATILRLYDAL